MYSTIVTGINSNTFHTQEIVKAKTEQLKKLAETYDLNHPVALQLMTIFRWNENQMLMKLYESNPDHALKDLKVDKEFKVHPGKTTCDVCCDDEDKELYGMSCEHFMCIDCWLNLAKTKLEDGKCFIKCPCTTCQKIAHQDLVLQAIQHDQILNVKYQHQLMNKMIEDDPNLIHCQGLRCTCVLKKDSEKDTLQCDGCGTYNCLKCSQEAHFHCTCKEAALIKSKYLLIYKEKESQKVIKQCPNCMNGIEKNGGCDHMKCKCGHDFSWNSQEETKEIEKEVKVEATEIPYVQQLKRQAEEVGFLSRLKVDDIAKKIRNVLIKARAILKWASCGEFKCDPQFCFQVEQLEKHTRDCIDTWRYRGWNYNVIDKANTILKIIITLEGFEKNEMENEFVIDKVALVQMLEFSNGRWPYDSIRCCLEASNNDVTSAIDFILDSMMQIE